jgi:hypothetical protein
LNHFEDSRAGAPAAVWRELLENHGNSTNFVDGTTLGVIPVTPPVRHPARRAQGGFR